MRAEVDNLYKRVDAHDTKVNSSILLRIKRKVEGTIGIGSKDRKTLLGRIEALDSRTVTKKHQGKGSKG
jgi:hypothetical protein